MDFILFLLIFCKDFQKSNPVITEKMLVNISLQVAERSFAFFVCVVSITENLLAELSCNYEIACFELLETDL